MDIILSFVTKINNKRCFLDNFEIYRKNQSKLTSHAHSYIYFCYFMIAEIEIEKQAIYIFLELPFYCYSTVIIF